ncbi:MAG: hypothetical protein AB7S50_14540 [Bacteroidales bacterium]
MNNRTLMTLIMQIYTDKITFSLDYSLLDIQIENKKSSLRRSNKELNICNVYE